MNAARRAQADVVLAVGRALRSMGKAIAALAHDDDAEDVEGFQTGRRRIDATSASGIAVPTTSGTGASTNNAVIELGDEKRSIRGYRRRS